MSNEQALEIYAEMETMFGDSLPNLEFHPIQFAYYYKLYTLIKRNAHH